MRIRLWTGQWSNTAQQLQLRATMQPCPLMPERFGRGDQFHPEWLHCGATPALPRTLSRTVAQRLWGAIHETYLTALIRELWFGFVQDWSSAASQPSRQAADNI